MKTKLIYLLSAILIAGVFSSCGGKKDEQKPETATQQEQVVEETTTPVEEAPIVEEATIEEAATPVEEAVKENEKNEKAAPKVAAGDYTKSPLVGEIISLDHLVRGGNGRVTKDEAKALVAKGSLILLKANGKIYFVYTEGGSFAAKKLANYAKAPKVGLLGTAKTVKGINMFIMTHIDAM